MTTEQTTTEVLTLEEAIRISQISKRITQRGSKYDLTSEEDYSIHAKLVASIANNYTGIEGRHYEIDEYNKHVLRFLIYYFNDCREAERVFPNEHYKLNKNLLLVGGCGTGKTLMMQIFAEYLRLTKNPNAFENISMTQLLNYQKMNGHIDKYTYNESGNSPLQLCLHDLGLETERAKSFGTELSLVVEEFLFARYEIFQQRGNRIYITSNLDVEDLRNRFGDRLIDRFSSFNIVNLSGESRRR